MIDPIGAPERELCTTPSQKKLVCVIPAFRASRTILSVIKGALPYCDAIVVVDDGCSEGTAEVVRAQYDGDPRVHVIKRSSNGGVGAATKTGIGAALSLAADIIVKLDADGQMNPSYISSIREAFEHHSYIVCVKGNRFFDASVISLMPKARLFGNAALSLFAKFASGYWNVIDPTNGYLAFDAHMLTVLPWQSFDDSYFFELSVLCELGLKKLPILELEMPTIYTDAQSSLSIRKVLLEFPGKLFRKTMRRLLVQYFIFDINLGTLYGFFGTLLLMFGLVFGGYEWIESVTTHVSRATGTIMLAVLPTLMGFQLLLQALMYDVQFSSKTRHELRIDEIQRRPSSGAAVKERWRG
jgi:glycosyltransferase involved in cell wall biosynthesis